MTTTPLTPRQAYDKARAEVQKQHRYTTEGIHAVCSCGEVGTTESIGDHIEKLADKAGHAAKDAEVERRAKEHEAAEEAHKAREHADAVRRSDEKVAQQQ